MELSAQKQRIQILDIIRGFALLGVFMVDIQMLSSLATLQLLADWL